jgi:hypothetical protein
MSNTSILDAPEHVLNAYLESRGITREQLAQEIEQQHQRDAVLLKEDYTEPTKEQARKWLSDPGLK